MISHSAPVLWELVHVFFEHKGLLADTTGAKHDAGASSFLYPFLDHRESDAERVLEDVRRSAILKADEVTSLRQRSMEQSDDVLCSAARVLRSAFDTGDALLVFGNGGSATDAMDAAADYRVPPPAGTRAKPSISRKTRRLSPRSQTTSVPTRFFSDRSSPTGDGVMSR